jgi:hypothetical protein
MRRRGARTTALILALAGAAPAAVRAQLEPVPLRDIEVVSEAAQHPNVAKALRASSIRRTGSSI